MNRDIFSTGLITGGRPRATGLRSLGVIVMKPYAALIVVLVLVFPGSPGLAGSLEVAYIEYPPYYYSRDGGRAGSLLDLSDRIFAEAGIPVTYTPMPAKRILVYIQENETPFASVGWFKTRDRESYAKYTLPIYTNRPLVVVTQRDSPVSQHRTLGRVLADSRLSLGRLQGYSDGDRVDLMIQRAAPEIITVVGTKVQLLRMLNAGRFSYMLLAPEELDSLCSDAGVDRDCVAGLPMDDIPTGNRRYIICSRSTPDPIIEKLNRAILKIAGDAP